MQEICCIEARQASKLCRRVDNSWEVDEGGES